MRYIFNVTTMYDVFLISILRSANDFIILCSVKSIRRVLAVKIAAVRLLELFTKL